MAETTTTGETPASPEDKPVTAETKPKPASRAKATEAPKTVDLVGSGGFVFTFDLPLNENIQDQLTKGLLRYPSPSEATAKAAK
jgi:hypothetical protein